MADLAGTSAMRRRQRRLRSWLRHERQTVAMSLPRPCITAEMLGRTLRTKQCGDRRRQAQDHGQRLFRRWPSRRGEAVTVKYVAAPVPWFRQLWRPQRWMVWTTVLSPSSGGGEGEEGEEQDGQAEVAEFHWMSSSSSTGKRRKRKKRRKKKDSSDLFPPLSWQYSTSTTTVAWSWLVMLVWSGCSASWAVWTRRTVVLWAVFAGVDATRAVFPCCRLAPDAMFLYSPDRGYMYCVASEALWSIFTFFLLGRWTRTLRSALPSADPSIWRHLSL